MKTRQLNCRIDFVTSEILEQLCKQLKGAGEKGRQTKVIKKALFELAQRELGEEKLKEIIYLSIKEWREKSHSFYFVFAIQICYNLKKVEGVVFNANIWTN